MLTRALKRQLSHGVTLTCLCSLEGNLDLGTDTRRHVHSRAFFRGYHPFRCQSLVWIRDPLGMKCSHCQAPFRLYGLPNGSYKGALQPVMFLAAGFGFGNPQTQLL